ncbi:nuclear transport factor 2 family protein [Saccharopolyspora indica]|uniref:nuclear transport factor 2 family protein n=1 Tax=Saccharopolyspora indica TaxID=1229659 RepID=UPI0022EB708E|nr:nuclear transport factor 2 family protein [Saccharopolyspora indica]MDA3647341.1 nuclear transport factor 2 family protein [Saccharopolyspora indica]
MDFRATTENFLTTLAGGDADEIAALFAERVDWKVYGSPDVPWLGHCTTREDVADFFRTMLGGFAPEGRSAEIDHILVDGPNSVVLGEITQVIKANGQAFTSPFALHLSGEEGLITRYHIYEDSFTIAQAATAEANHPEESLSIAR